MDNTALSLKQLLGLRDEAWVYIDEAGSVRQGKPFTVGLFITWRDEMWREIIRDIRRKLHYTASLHFHKISTKPDDRRVLVYQRIIDKLHAYPKTWYGRTVYVDRKRAQFLRRMSEVDAYDLVMTHVIEKFIPAVRDRKIHVVVSDKHRPVFDDYLPSGLEARLNQLSGKRSWGQTFDVCLRPASADDLLQLSDFLASAEWQKQHPSANPNKLQLTRQLFHGGTEQRIVRWVLTL